MYDASRVSLHVKLLTTLCLWAHCDTVVVVRRLISSLLAGGAKLREPACTDSSARAGFVVSLRPRQSVVRSANVGWRREEHGARRQRDQRAVEATDAWLAPFVLSLIH